MTPVKTPRGTRAAADTPENLLAYALAMESEAAERYAELADQMAVHNNQEVAALFRKLGEIEYLHAENIRRQAAGHELPRISLGGYRWGSRESPEALDPGEVHYLITPHQAVRLALRHEQQAAEFYGTIARGSGNREVQALAKGYEEEEREHVRLLTEWLERYPVTGRDWDDDPDPPMEQE